MLAVALPAIGDFRAWLAEPIVTLVIAFGIYQVLGLAVLIVLEHDSMLVDHMILKQVTPPGQLRASCAVGLGLGFAALGYICSPSMPSRLALLRACHAANAVSPNRCVALFVVVGGGAHLLNTTMWLSGTNVHFGQALPTLVNFALAGVLLATWLTPSRWWLIVALCLAASMSMVGLLQLSKQSFAKPIVAVLAGLGLRRTGLLSGVVLASLPPIAVWSVASLVGQARMLPVDYWTSAADTGSALTEAISASPSSNARDWLRFNYSSTQEAVMRLFESGVSGTDLELIPWVVVPRFVAPSKPIMTRGGAEMYEHLTGLSGSSDSAGIFIDGYFQCGWPGLVVFSFVTGIVLAQFGVLSTQLACGRAMLLAPIAALGHFVGIRIDGLFVPDVLSSWVYLWVFAGVVLLAFGQRTDALSDDLQRRAVA